MKDYHLKKDKEGNPLLSDCIVKDKGGTFRSTKEVLTLFRSLYFNTYGMQDKFIAFW